MISRARNQRRRRQRNTSTRSLPTSRATHQLSNPSAILCLGSHHTHQFPTLLCDKDEDNTISDQSDDDSSSLSSGLPQRRWDLEEWSDEEQLHHLQDLQDLEFLNNVHQMRIDRWEHSRLDWEEHVRKLMHEDLFENEYGMPLGCYRELVHILDPILRKKEYNCCDELIPVDHVVANGLRILGGGRPKDQRHIMVMSRDASYKSFCSFLDAVNSASKLDIKMPSTPEEWDEIYQEYKRKSTHKIMAGCVGCLDGFFKELTNRLRVKLPMSYHIIPVIMNLMVSTVRHVFVPIYSLCILVLFHQDQQTTTFHTHWHKD